MIDNASASAANTHAPSAQALRRRSRYCYRARVFALSVEEELTLWVVELRLTISGHADVA
ncbi:MAG: hypothetical protein R3E42_09690 [Burkholderiaceae bacterium]